MNIPMNAPMAIDEGAACPVPPPVADVSIENYHGRRPEVSPSSAKIFKECPRRYYDRLSEIRAGRSVYKPRTRKDYALNLGSAIHGHFLDEDKGEQYRELLSASYLEKLDGMVDKLEHAPAGTYAEQIHRLLTTPAGRSEWSYFFNCPATGIACKVRYDRLIWNPVKRLLVNLDLKHTRHATLRKILYAPTDFDYHRQVAMQEDGLRVAFGQDVEIASFWGFISSEYPHPAVILRPKPEKVEEARASNIETLLEIRELLETQPDTPWPARVQPWEMRGEMPEA